MTIVQSELRDNQPTGEAVVWIDHERAVIVQEGSDGEDRELRLDRWPAESETAFEVRAIRAIKGQDRVVITGPDGARITFERTYVAMTHRPESLTDLQSTPPSSVSPND